MDVAALALRLKTHLCETDAASARAQCHVAQPPETLHCATTATTAAETRLTPAHKRPACTPHGQIKTQEKAVFHFFSLNLHDAISANIITTYSIVMTQEEKTRIEERIVDVLKTVYDPEIPVNIYDLGLIYNIDVQDDGNVNIDMTFTAPSCPAADFILEDVRLKVDSLENVAATTVNLVFEPVWDQSMMSEEARVELGFD